MKLNSMRELATTLVPTFLQNTTIGEAKASIVSDSKRFKTINYCYLLDESKRLVGTISIKDILSQKEDTAISSIMTKDVISVHEHTHREKVARISLDNNIKAIPIVDKDNVFLGVIPSDVILQILDEEMHEDMLKFGGHTGGAASGSETIFGAIISRTPWLIIGTLGGILTAHIIKSFQELSGTTIAIASFIPLIVYVASAVVAQLNALVIRQISTGVKVNIFKYASKQLIIIGSIAIILAIVLEVVLLSLGHPTDIRRSISAGLFFTCLSAIIAGIFIPHLFSRLRIDPASASGPVATIIQDMSSIVIFLTIANLI